MKEIVNLIGSKLNFSFADIVNDEKLKSYFEEKAYDKYDLLIKNNFIDKFLEDIENFSKQ